MRTELPQSDAAPAATTAEFAGGVAAVRGELARWRSQSESLLPALGLQETLLAELERAYQEAADAHDGQVARAIQKFDPLYAAAAGGGDEVCFTSPPWFTRLTEAPRELRWSESANGEWKVILKPDGQPSISLGVTTENRISVPDDVRARLTSGTAITWKVARPGQRDARCRAVFVVEPAGILLTDDKSPQTWQDVVARAPETLNAELFDGLLRELASFDETERRGVSRFLISRVRAAVYRAMANRLNGPPYWMGDPEGVWATDAGRQELQAAWAAIGVAYRD